MCCTGVWLYEFQVILYVVSDDCCKTSKVQLRLVTEPYGKVFTTREVIAEEILVDSMT